MRNLKQNGFKLHKLSTHQTKSQMTLCVNPLSSDTYCVSTLGIIQITQDDSTSVGIDMRWEDDDKVVTDIVSAGMVPALDSIVVVTSDDIISYNLETMTAELVGSVSDGILAACWSPDQEILIVVTKELDVMMMNANFEPLNELTLVETDFGTQNFVNVGWGKKETQFHGKEGKDAAKIKHQTVAAVSETETQCPTITWRGDGQLFAIGYISPECGNRKIRVINREGILQATSEDINLLEQCLSWKPSGSLIASSQKYANHHNIVFFEKNGLKHGEFVFCNNPSTYVVNNILWSQDSNVLLVWVKDTTDTQISTIQLWTVGNYHWYLKQQFSVADVQSIQWDESDALNLYVLTSSDLHVYKYVFDITSSISNCEADASNVAVIDGNKLLITPFRQLVVPPPISAYEVQLPSMVHEVLFLTYPGNLSNDDSDCNNICVYHGDSVFTFLTQTDIDNDLSTMNCEIKVTGGSTGFRMRSKVHKVFAQAQLDQDGVNIFGRLYNCLWINKSKLAACFTDCDGTHHFVLLTCVLLPNEQNKVKVIKTIAVSEQIVRTAQCARSGLVCVQYDSGALGILENDQIVPWLTDGKAQTLPRLCDELSLVTLDSKAVVPIARSHLKHLYLGDKLLFPDCNSFVVHNEHLLVTTTSHKLYVIPLKLDALMNKERFSETGVRKLERGSRLVVAVSHATRVVMQMPRGNLEEINPRPLLIHLLKAKLDSLSYKCAVETMRRNRLDLNLVYDHNPSVFTTHVQDFVSCVNNPQWIDLFVANLNNESVTDSTYSYAYLDKSHPPCDQKVATVCKLVRNAMMTVDEDKFLLPILTTYVRTSEMEQALRKLMQLKRQNENSKVTFADGLRHLMYVADANELCSVALGTYDFDLVMMVYEKSQKDPKEYIPFLNGLKALEPSYREYRINVHLKRYNLALHSALKCDECHMEEVIVLIKTYHLFKQAVQIFTVRKDWLKRVCYEFGLNLSARCFNTEAAMMYHRAGRLQMSLDSHLTAGDWRAGIAVALQMKMDDSKFKTMCRKLVERLAEQNDFCDAAHILEHYLVREEEAVSYYLQGHAWSEAMMIAHKYNRPDLMEANVNISLMETYSTFSSNIVGKHDEFTRILTRLQTVRSSKFEEYQHWLAAMDDEDLDPELYSDTSTVTGISYQRSQFSQRTTSTGAKTYRSGKNKRKLERKKYSTKEGSSFEDLGLIAAMHDLMMDTDKLCQQIYKINCALILFGKDLEANTLQTSLESMIADMKKQQNFIWCLQEASTEDVVEFGATFSTNNTINALQNGGKVSLHDFYSKRMKELELHYQLPPQIGKIPWKLCSI